MKKTKQFLGGFFGVPSYEADNVNIGYRALESFIYSNDCRLL